MGLAGFPSGEAYKIGNWTPYYRMPRAFLRQTFALGGEEGPVESGPNTLAGTKAINNVTLTMGKFSAVDSFDTNAYAHDPRADFMNWAVVESGAVKITVGQQFSLADAKFAHLALHSRQTVGSTVLIP